MSAINTLILGGLLLLFVQHSANAQVVIEDAGVSLSQDELAYIVRQWPVQMQQSAASDLGDRLELLNMVLTIKKLSLKADEIEPGSDSDAYWKYHSLLMKTKRDFVLEEYSKNLVIPDMSELAAEHYQTEKEKYALVPEKRLSSHILFACPPGQCSREDTKVKAQKVLDELRAGADFVEMVHTYSDDSGTKAKDGRFDKWVSFGEIGVSPRYSEGVFSIANKGEYSELVSSEFGIHIIRLDGIEDKHYLPYEEVKAKIVSDLETEFRKLSITEYNNSFNLTDDVKIDGKAMEQIFSPYQVKSE